MLVDMHGNPIQAKQLQEKQTESIAQVAQRLKQYAEHPSQGLTPATLARLLRDSEQGNLAAISDLAKDMEDKDGHLFSEISKRRRAWLKFDWNIEPPRNPSAQEKRDTAELNEILSDATWFTDLLFDLSDAVLKGFSACELRWSYIEKKQIITSYDARDQSIFKTHPDNANQLVLDDSSQNGLALTPFGWAVHIHKSKTGYIHRAGLASVLAWPFLFKNYSIRDLAEFLEIYGLPLRLGKYPIGASEQEKTTLLQAVLSIGHNAGGIIPKGMDIDFQNAASGHSDPFEAMIRWCESTQSKAILGGTLTSQADGKTSTNALGNIHMEALNDITESDLIQVAQTITRDFIYPMYALNGQSYSGPHRSPKLIFDVSEPEDLELYAKAVPLLVNTGMPIPVSWMQSKLHIPSPEKGEEVLQPPQVKKEASLKSTVALKQSEELADDLDLIQQRLSKEMQPFMDGLLKPVQQAVLKARSLSELKSDLINLSGELSIDELGSQMQKAIAVSTLLGRQQVEDGK